MTLDDKAKYVSEQTGLPYHLFLGYVTGDVRIECAKGELRPSQESIEAFENEIGFKLPVSFKTFLLDFGSLYMEANENAWPKIDGVAVLPFWATNYGFIIYGLGETIPEHLNIRRKFYQFKEVFPELPFFLPVHRLVPGDQSYIGYNIDSELVVKYSGESKLYPLKQNIDELIVSEAKELKERMAKRKKLNIEVIKPQSQPQPQPQPQPKIYRKTFKKIRQLFKR